MTSKQERPGLPPRQERFCQEYLKDLNASQAAIRAGYGKKNADVEGSRLLVKAEIASRVRDLLAERAERVKVEQDDVLRELLLVMTSDITDFEIRDGWVAAKEGARPGAIRSVASFKKRTKRYLEGKGEGAQEVEVEEVEIRLWDKNAAITNAGKHLGLFPSKVNLGDPDEVLSKLLGVGKEELP